jgi:hypothetical protein
VTRVWISLRFLTVAVALASGSSTLLAGVPSAESDVYISSAIEALEGTGQPITVVLTIGNLGPDSASVHMNDRLPHGAALLSWEVAHSDGREFPGGCIAGTGGSIGWVSCGVGTIEAGGTATIRLRIAPIGPGEQSNYAFVITGLSNDPNITNNTSTVLFSLGPAVPSLSPWMLCVLILAIASTAAVRLVHWK